MRTLLLCTLCLLLAPAPAAAVVAQFGASKDNTLYENEPGISNGAGEHLFAGRAGQLVNPVRRGLIAFDLSAIPAGSAVVSVQLTLHMSRTSAGVEPVALHRVLKDWGEGSSKGTSGEGGGGIATAGDATWEFTHFNTISWINQGGDFEPTASASQAIGDIGTYNFVSTPGLVADVQHWADFPGQNFGWILIGNEVSSTTTAKRFDSKDNTILSNRPVLQVEYIPPGVGVDGGPLAANRLELLPVAPNPVASTATFRFRLSEAGTVRLAVFDVSGRRVADLVREERPAGEHVVKWDPHGAAPGAYWVRVEAGGVMASRSFRLTAR